LAVVSHEIRFVFTPFSRRHCSSCSALAKYPRCSLKWHIGHQ
jgi:hypothetical protein